MPQPGQVPSKCTKFLNNFLIHKYSVCTTITVFFTVNSESILILLLFINHCDCNSEERLQHCDLCLLHHSSCLCLCPAGGVGYLRDLLLQDPVQVEGLDENLSELAVLPSIDDDIDTGVKNKEQVGDIGKN